MRFMPDDHVTFSLRDVRRLGDAASDIAMAAHCSTPRAERARGWKRKHLPCHRRFEAGSARIAMHPGMELRAQVRAWLDA
jgi:hypothetical protein